MNKIILTTLATITTTGLLASPPQRFDHSDTFMDTEETSSFSYVENIKPKRGFFYVRFAAAEADLENAQSAHPGLGIGLRKLAGNGAIDFSINGIGYSEGTGSESYWSAPKVSYIHYFTPKSTKTLYLGGGLSWGGIRSRDKHEKFIGIIPNAILGFEFFHNKPILGFAELSISKPFAPVFIKGDIPGPIAEFSIGAGF